MLSKFMFWCLHVHFNTCKFILLDEVEIHSSIPNSQLVPVWKGSRRGRGRGLTVQLDLGNGRCLAPPPVLEVYILSTVPRVELFSRIRPSECKVLLRPSGLIMWLNPVKSSTHTFKNLTNMEIYLSFVTQNMSYVFPCLLNLLPTNLEGPVSFFSLSLPCMYRHQLINQQFLSEVLKNQHITQSFEMIL